MSYAFRILLYPKVILATVAFFIPIVTFAAPVDPTDAVISSAVAKIDQGALPSEALNIAINRNFPQVQEQNFARMGPLKTQALIDTLSDLELSHLAQAYTNAIADTGRTANLLPLLAIRLDGQRLAKVASHFGYASVYAAISTYAPTKLSAFQANVTYAAPEIVVGAPPRGSSMQPMGGGLTKYYNWTPTQIYLDLRTAPVGALGTVGALYETAAIFGTYIPIAWEAGQTAGTAIKNIIATYDPPLYDAIGGTVANMVVNLTAAYDLTSQGNIQSGIGAVFGVSSSVRNAQTSYGGDYNNSAGWDFITPALPGGICAGTVCHDPR